jgi:DMSO reductase iron-sulfur subunit
MSLPLLVRAPGDDGTFVHVVERRRGDRATKEPSVHPVSPSACGLDARGRMPDRLPDVGEQYRFHVDMTACIGCKCCVVACNEQNGNPAEINWRRVAELEGGRFPAATRAYFSMGCNHCADPTCLSGCPVDAYSKDSATGIVRHSAETCIGCQYCTWTCSYGVPQFNAERRVVGKCDMCYGRLSAGQAPACVSACPEGAIAIEIVNVAEWRAASAAKADGLPQADGSLSTTRVTLPPALPANLRPVDLDRVVPGDPHLPLVVMTVLTQISAGAFAAMFIAMLTGWHAGLLVPSILTVAATGFALAASTAHLGRPIHAYRAMRMWRRSWLSREVVLFGAFAKASAATVAMIWWGGPLAPLGAAATALVGLTGVFASARIYHVVSRPSWNSWRTELEFFGTAAIGGTLFAAASGIGPSLGWQIAAATISLLMLVVTSLDDRRRSASASVELRGRAKLLATVLRVPSRLRVACLLLGGIALPLIGSTTAAALAALVVVTVGELLGRYLFFVSAVPKHLTAAYAPVASEAA